MTKNLYIVFDNAITEVQLKDGPNEHILALLQDGDRSTIENTSIVL